MEGYVSQPTYHLTGRSFHQSYSLDSEVESLELLKWVSNRNKLFLRAASLEDSKISSRQVHHCSPNRLAAVGMENDEVPVKCKHNKSEPKAPFFRKHFVN